MPGFLKNDFRAGQPIAALDHSWLNKVANFINSLIVVGGSLQKTESLEGCRLYVDATDNVRGTPGLYKGIFMRGYTRASASVDFPSTPDSVTTEMAGGYSAGLTTGSETKVLLATWDYPRIAYDEPLS